MSKSRKVYIYEGPVYYFANIREQFWKASTWAESPRKAISNLTHRYKSENDFAGSAKISLDPCCLKEDK